MNSSNSSDSSECPLETTHHDLLNKIIEIETKIEDEIEGLRKELFWASIKVGGIAIPVAAAILLWVWGTVRDQAATNGELRARVDAAESKFEDSKLMQARIESRLDEINRYIREDSRELRDVLTRHIDGVLQKGGE